MQIKEFQGIISQKYEKRDRERGIQKTFLWFIEEVGELATALAGTDQENREEEFADVLDGFYKQLNEILQGMIRDLNREEFSNLLRRIIEWSRKLQQQIEEEQKAKTKELFER